METQASQWLLYSCHLTLSHLSLYPSLNVTLKARMKKFLHGWIWSIIFPYSSLTHCLLLSYSLYCRYLHFCALYLSVYPPALCFVFPLAFVWPLFWQKHSHAVKGVVGGIEKGDVLLMSHMSHCILQLLKQQQCKELRYEKGPLCRAQVSKAQPIKDEFMGTNFRFLLKKLNTYKSRVGGHWVELNQLSEGTGWCEPSFSQNLITFTIFISDSLTCKVSAQ